MKILLVAATEPEAGILKDIKGITGHGLRYRFGELDIHPLVTGIGSVATVYGIFKWIEKNGVPDLAINTGIAGSFSDEIVPGDVVIPVRDCFADLGIDDNGRFLTLEEAGLADNNEYPFTNGWIEADEVIASRFGFLKPVSSVTVNTATGSDAMRASLVKCFKPDTETMEGASFFYICRREGIPFMAIRSVSNRIEPRKKENWNIKLAFENLAKGLGDVFETLNR